MWQAEGGAAQMANARGQQRRHARVGEWGRKVRQVVVRGCMEGQARWRWVRPRVCSVLARRYTAAESEMSVQTGRCQESICHVHAHVLLPRLSHHHHSVRPQRPSTPKANVISERPKVKKGTRLVNAYRWQCHVDRRGSQARWLWRGWEVGKGGGLNVFRR